MVVALVVAGCGGGGSGDGGSAEGDEARPATSPQEFAARFAELTGLRLRPAEDPLGTRLDVPDEPDLNERFGTYGLTWATEETRDTLVGDAPPDARGIVWERVGDGWSAAKAYGPNLVLSWVGEERKGTTPRFDRLDRAVRAAFEDRPEVLRPEERPCAIQRLEPLRSGTGVCAVTGVPVRFAGAREPMRTEALETRVLGATTTDEVSFEGGTLPPEKAEGRYVVVAYRIRNPRGRPLRFVTLHLRVAGRTIRADAGAGALLPRSRPFPLERNATMDARAVFDVPEELADRALREGALVVPAAFGETGDPSEGVEQAWIRLADAPRRLPRAPQPEPPPGAPPPMPEPAGPPTEPERVRGDGPVIGATAREVFHATAYFPVPETFEPGGIEVGTRAGTCRVPRPARSVLAGLYRKLLRDTRGEGRLDRPVPRRVLLADCAQGRFAMVTWAARRPGRKGPTVFLDVFERVGGGWRGTSEEGTPGCQLPVDAAAAWQIDLTACETARRTDDDVGTPQ